MEPVIVLDDVWKRYDMGKAGGLTVLKEIDLKVERGEFVAVVGPSGSGKSTMVNMIGALDIPSYGTIYLDEKDIGKMKESSLVKLRSKKVGFIFQQFNLIHTLSALQNVMLPMEIVDTSEKIARDRATKLLVKLGLGNRLNHKPNELSGGQQQRVAIARSLANDPEVILADEPTGNLDSKTGKFVMDFLGKLNGEGKTVVIVTHDLNLVQYAKRVIYVMDGRIEKSIKSKETHRGKR